MKSTIDIEKYKRDIYPIHDRLIKHTINKEEAADEIILLLKIREVQIRREINETRNKKKS